MSLNRLPIRAAAAIIFIFSFLLFLSGYILQQQSIAALSAALPTPTHTRAQKHSAQISRQHLAAGLTSQPPIAASNDLQAQFLLAAHHKTHAYATAITTPSEACHALQLFAGLAALRDTAPTTRILYHPASWAATGAHPTAARLLRSATVRYGVRLVPVPGLEAAPALALAAAFREADMRRIALLDVRGILLQSLDSLLLAPAEGVVVTGIRDPAAPTRVGEALLVVTPDEVQAARVAEIAERDGATVGGVVNELFGNYAALLPSHPWVTPLGVFKTAGRRAAYRMGAWDAGKVRNESRYVSFAGEREPWRIGSGRGSTGVVAEMYRRWEKTRAEVCGLDLM
ncbi:hypothetical protein EDC01DRAFT_782392 [Geopyxis carbonaria]|nr:hypothetical protein EDC01DRAFT_782392 [Geopyxis carbonaria]